MNIEVQLGPYENPDPMTLSEINRLKDLGDHGTAEVTINNLAAFRTFAECKKFCTFFIPPFLDDEYSIEVKRLNKAHCKECFEKHKAICTFLFDEYPEIFVKELGKHSDINI
jgi:hypothetical protein